MAVLEEPDNYNLSGRKITICNRFRIYPKSSIDRQWARMMVIALFFFETEAQKQNSNTNNVK